MKSCPASAQHGAYLTREKLWEVATSPEALLKLCSDLLAEREKNAALQADNARLQGKAVYYDLFIDLRHSTNPAHHRQGAGGAGTAVRPLSAGTPVRSTALPPAA